ncbi:MAG: MFS transporter [Actinomycetota bacterium]|nr:MFS transporter [Actinomycetota bacterium]
MTATAPPVATTERRTASHGAILATLSLAAFMASLDLFIVNVAFPDISRDFGGTSLADLSWVLNGYAVLYAALLVPLGRLADRYGRLAGFLAGLALFTGASAACAASQGLWTLVVFRGLQAVGAAALTPTSLGLLLTATPDAGKVRAVRIWASVGGLAAAFGPGVGGLLVEASWRWVFIVNVPVGVAAFVVARRVVPDSRDLTVSKTPDLGGSAAFAIGIGALALALVQGSGWGWSSVADLAAFAVSAAALAIFWRRSTRHPLPVVEPALLRVKTFAWSNVTVVLFSVAFAGGLLAMVLWLQQAWGYSALRTGLAIAPGPMMVPLFAAVAQRLSARVHAGLLAAFGCLLFGVGTALLAMSVELTPSYVTAILPGWLVGGVGVGFALPTIISAATADLPPARAATGSAVVTMARQIGLVLGVSLLVAVVGTPSGRDAVLTAFQSAWWAIAAVAGLAAVTASRMTPRGAT